MKKLKYIAVFLCLSVLAINLCKGVEKDFSKAEWIVTQYAPRNVNLNFYTIYNPKKGLIVIDGGWREDASYVRSTIEQLGGKVDAWILTHPHPDHIGAFNEIYQDCQGIGIKDVYTVQMSSVDVCKRRAKWDVFDAYEDFLELDVKDLQYVHSGEILEICGLEFDILSAYGSYVERLSKDYMNDGSMMFKVKAKEQSFLFCADVGESVSDYLLEKWGNDLQATYLQMGHHGYGGLKDDFYKKVHPQTAFFDAPDEMMEDTTGKFDNPENKKLMSKMGSDIKSFCTAPNTVILK